MQITFFGAAREVTGSCSLLEAGGLKILIDCGLYQGGREQDAKNVAPLFFDSTSLDAVIVTHAHLDHTGRLPLLIKGGFNGWFYATPATRDLTRLILEDELMVMTHNNRDTGSPILFNEQDIAGVMERFKSLDYYEELVLPDKNGGVKIILREAGHIFGSAFVEIVAEKKHVVFSGDVGNVDMPILRPTDMLPDNVDVLVCESTYGDRVHESPLERQDLIESLIREGVAQGGTLMIPSFSLERTQELLYDLNDLVDRKKRLPPVPIFLDSPLAIRATRVYQQYEKYYNEEAKRLMSEGDDLFRFEGLTQCETREESKRVNQTTGAKVIIAGAGMMNGGRIIHHALRYLSDRDSTLLFIGYQAHGTLGRRILDGESPVHIMGERVSVHCHIKAIGALSAHADQEKLLNWIGGGKMTPKKVYLNHGEPLPAEALAKRLKDDLGVKATVVDYGLKIKV